MFPIELTPSNVFTTFFCGKEFKAYFPTKTIVFAFPNTYFTDKLGHEYTFAERPKSSFKPIARLPPGIFITLEDGTSISFKEDTIIDIAGCSFMPDADMTVYSSGNYCTTLSANFKYSFGKK